MDAFLKELEELLSRYDAEFWTSPDDGALWAGIRRGDDGKYETANLCAKVFRTVNGSTLRDLREEEGELLSKVDFKEVEEAFRKASLLPKEKPVKVDPFLDKMFDEPEGKAELTEEERYEAEVKKSTRHYAFASAYVGFLGSLDHFLELSETRKTHLRESAELEARGCVEALERFERDEDL